MNTDSDKNKKRVAIIGGGLAGLSAAESLLRCHADRFAVTLLESKRVTGGRAGSFERADGADGNHSDVVDYCQHVAMGCCTNLIGLMNRCELMDTWQRYDELTFLHPDHPPSRFGPAKWLPAPLHLALAISQLNHLTWQQHRSIRHGLLRLMRTRSEDLRDVTAENWLIRVGQERSTIRDFWDVILVSALGEESKHVSMAAARKVLIDGFARCKGASDILVPTQPLSKLIGQQLTGAIRDLGAIIRTQSTVDSVIDSPRGVRLADADLPCDHVISAVPWHVVERLLSEPAVASSIRNLQTIKQFPTSSITGLHLWFDRPITDLPHAVLVGTISQWLFRDPVAAESSDRIDGHYYQVVISASRQAKTMGKTELVQQVCGELRRLFPAAGNAQLIRSQVVTDPNSVFSVRPEVESTRPPAHTALPWFHLAGDWIATTWPATMEGAVISGIMAASSVMENEGIAGIQPDPGLSDGLLSKWLIK
ncbi:MAG: NAD(P)-binding protein [Pirellulaceae bacterium]|nr:NAD(P)-binding protein [Pirellulaceae bacterium]